MIERNPLTSFYYSEVLEGPVEGPEPLVLYSIKDKSKEWNYKISSQTGDFFMFSHRSGAAIKLRNTVDRKLQINPLTIFNKDDSQLNFQIIYGIAGEKPFFTYNPSSRILIFPNGKIFVPNWGIIDGFVDGNYWLMEKPNQWQTFDGRVIRIKRGPYPEFSLAIGDVLNTKGLVLDEKLLDELVLEYGSIDQLISIYMEENDQQLKELIAKALNVMEPFSYNLLIASVRLPNPEDVENILNKNSNLLEARSLSLRFALRVRLATREEAEIIDNLSPTDEFPFDE